MTTKLSVANLGWKVKIEDLREKFAPFGEITEAVIIMERDDPSRSRGFGFVHYVNEADAQAAIKGLHGKTFMKKNLVVKIAHAR